MNENEPPFTSVPDRPGPVGPTDAARNPPASVGSAGVPGRGTEPPSDSEEAPPNREVGATGRTEPVRATPPAVEPPFIPDRFGAVFPDGAVYDATEGARLFDQDAEQRARAMAVTIGGRPVRIRTMLEWLPPESE
jgi:hypothetical protein